MAAVERAAGFAAWQIIVLAVVAWRDGRVLADAFFNFARSLALIFIAMLVVMLRHRPATLPTPLNRP